jgi:hypothetical protein
MIFLYTFLFLVLNLLAFPILFVFYLAIMNLKNARDDGKITKIVYGVALPIETIGYLIDFYFNVVPFSIIFLEPPQEWVVTARLQRHVSHSTGWRNKVALWFANNLLNPFSREPHIKIPV